MTADSDHLNSQPQPLLNTLQVAEILLLRPNSVEKMRMRGDGPPFIRVTPRAIRYRLEDVEKWVTSQARRSTSDPGEVGKNG